jgi:hypothetical protein
LTPTTSCQELYAWGLRNPFRFAFDPNTGPDRFFINDVGQSTHEEIDQGGMALNYGWPIREGFCLNGQSQPCAPPDPALGFTDPITDYPRTLGQVITASAFIPNGHWPAEFDGGYLFADAGSGLRAGQALALPEVPCRGDVFHILHDLQQLAGFLENRAYGLLETCQHHQQQRDRQRQRQRHRRGRPIASSPASTALRLRHARVEAAAAMTLYDDVALLIGWLRHDILAVAGPCAADRRALFDFVVAELKSRTSLCSHRLGPVCRMLENQRDDLLAFARALDDDLELLGQEFQVPAELLRQLLGTLARNERDPRRWSEETALRQRFRGRFHDVQAAVATLAKGTVRASSLVENLNSRLRSYFFLRRHLGSDYLALLQFFLNHRRLERSDRPERVGKTPAELLSGQSHPHWLEMLGYTRFARA